MRIKTRLSITFVSVLMFILLIISSYSILFIRNYLEKKAVNEALSQANSIALNLKTFDNNEDAKRYLRATANLQQTIVILFNPEERPIWFSSDIEETKVEILPEGQIEDGYGEYVGAWRELIFEEANKVVVLRSKRAISLDLMPIRYIIYSGMLLSAIIIIIVSFLTARSLSRPIQELASSAEDIAAGNFDKQLVLERKDEFGNLAQSLNSMASTLKKESDDLRIINEKQKRFYADIAHEIKNPMHTMLGSIDILTMENISKEHLQKYIRVVKNQAERVYRLFEDLVTLQKYDSYETKINPVSFDFGLLARKIIQNHEISASSKKVSLECSVPQIKVFADESKITQVLDNLLTNAVKSTDKGSVILQGTVNDQFLEVEIIDTGAGMSDDELERIFDRFYRTDESRSRDSGGSGLGLAITKSILEAHGQKIHVSSQLGIGSIFSFNLPLSKENSNSSFPKLG